MECTDWQETIMCYCAADSFEPEKLKVRLQNDPNWNEDFRHAFEVVLATGDFNSNDWSRDVNFHFRSDREFANWLQAIFNFLYFSGLAPDAPNQ